VSYPVYTVDLVGGEKIGGANLIDRPIETKAKSTTRETAKTVPEASPPQLQKTQQKTQKTDIQPATRGVKTVKKEEKSVRDEPVKLAEKAALKPDAGEAIGLKRAKEDPPARQEPKAESAAASEAGQELPSHLREKLIQAALDRLKERAQKAPPPSKAKDVAPRELGTAAPRSSAASGEGAALRSGPGTGDGAAALGRGGTGGGIVKPLEFVLYRNRISNIIKEQWVWGDKRKTLEAIVSFGIRENGEIFGVRLTRASGDAAYDDSVLRAINRANPLPPPPERHRKEFMDVELTFRPQDLHG
jgi:colicin import membrane protein